MPAVQETVDQVRRIDVDQYKYGFETLIESDKAPKGLSEDTVRFISAKKNEPEWMLAWRLDAYQALADHARAEMGQGRIRPDRLSGHLLLFRAEEEGRAEVARRDRSGNSAHLREARHSAARARGAARRAEAGGRGRRARRGRQRLWPRRGRCGVRFRFGRHHLQGRAGQGRRAVHADLGGAAASIPTW